MCVGIFSIDHFILIPWYILLIIFNELFWDDYLLDVTINEWTEIVYFGKLQSSVCGESMSSGWKLCYFAVWCHNVLSSVVSLTVLHFYLRQLKVVMFPCCMASKSIWIDDRITWQIVNNFFVTFIAVLYNPLHMVARECWGDIFGYMKYFPITGNKINSHSSIQ